MLISKLNGAIPIAFKLVILKCPQDCGGADFDEIDYVPICPSCNRRFGALERDERCKVCGQKLYWDVESPKIIDKT